MNNKHDLFASEPEIARLYHESYRSCIEQITYLKRLLEEHSKQQYMNPDDYSYVDELIFLNGSLEDCINQLK